jgi:DUF1009 family protein
MLALIAGTGGLPGELVRHLDARPIICALEQFPPEDLAVDMPFRLETFGTLLAALRERGVSEICMAGAIRRPDIDPSLIDRATVPLVPILQKALLAGDDGALRGVIGILEQAGIRVRAAHHLAPDLLPPAGCRTTRQPDDRARADVRRAVEVVSAMSAADIGQACAVKAGQALAIESIYGTDWMLATLAQRPDPGQGGVFYKAPKSDQDLRVDLPTIGLGTIRAAAEAGLDGLAIAAGGVIILDEAAVIAECDRLGLFLWVCERDG